MLPKQAQLKLKLCVKIFIILIFLLRSRRMRYDFDSDLSSVVAGIIRPELSLIEYKVEVGENNKKEIQKMNLFK